jgi:serine/threonine protein kinase
MQQDRRQEISNLYHAALTRPLEERSAYLRAACAGDESLLHEVESLLAYASAAPEFLETCAFGVPGSPPAAPWMGRNIGPFHVVAPLGAGGMGEVYRARDSKLGRDVAIKILPRDFGADPERRARFAREARMLATLSHPHIGAIYGLEQADGVDALVLELVEGPTLAQELERGPLLLLEALAVAKQISDALASAHEKGIVHRDLKPANIVLQITSGERRVKVLDFGLAKVASEARRAEPHASAVNTEDGRILGTPAYMSPEQARGQAVDARTDIWAFGCVLFEVLSGRRAFEAETLTDTLAHVLQREPDWSVLPSATPTGIRALIRRCLQKDPGQRLPHIAEARVEIDEHLSRSARWRLSSVPIRQILTVAVVLLLMAGLLIWRANRPAPLTSASPIRLTFEPGLQTGPTFSPEGESIAYASNQSGNFDIWTMPIEGGNPVQVTTDPAHDWQPDWSPNQNRIAFRSERDGGGVFVALSTGGPATQITQFGYEPQWAPDGSRILFTGSKAVRGGVYTIALDEAKPRPVDVSRLPILHEGLTSLNTLVGWHSNSKEALFFSVRGDGDVALTAVDVTTGQIKSASVANEVREDFRRLPLRPALETQKLVCAPDGSAVFFLALSQEIRSVWKVDVNPRTFRVTGGPHRVTMVESGSVAVSRDGRRLAFDAADRRTRVYLYPLDPSGRQVINPPRALTSEPESAFRPDLSRDGKMLLFTAERPGAASHVHYLRYKEVPNGREQRLLSADLTHGINGYRDFRFSPDGLQFAFRYVLTSNPTRRAEESIWLFDLRTGQQKPLTSPVGAYDVPFGWSADGLSVIAASGRYRPGMAIALVPLSGAPKAETTPKIVTDSAEFGLWNASMSPKGRWICFNATKAGRSKIVVVDVENSDENSEWIEITDGTFLDDKPRWSLDGRLLYFVSDRGGLLNVWAVGVDPATGARDGDPFQVTHFQGPGLQLPSLEGLEIGVGGGALSIPVANPSGGIWVLENAPR